MNADHIELSKNFHVLCKEIDQIERLKNELVSRRNIISIAAKMFTKEALHVLPCETWIDCGDGLIIYIEHPDKWDDNNTLENIRLIETTPIKREVDHWVASQEAPRDL